MSQNICPPRSLEQRKEQTQSCLQNNAFATAGKAAAMHSKFLYNYMHGGNSLHASQILNPGPVSEKSDSNLMPRSLTIMLLRASISNPSPSLPLNALPFTRRTSYPFSVSNSSTLIFFPH